MEPKIKFYTSKVSTNRSIDRIKKLLLEFGAENFNENYENGKIKSIAFSLRVNDMPIFFRLPAKTDKIFEELYGLRKSQPSAAAYKAIHDQAERTAWRLNSEWIDMQLTMVRLKQAEPMEIFLAFAYDAATDQTFYEKLKGENFKLLT